MSEDFPATTASGPFFPSGATITLLAPGTSIGGRYLVEGVLGSGGYAVVYLAFDRELARTVALKVLRPERASSDGLTRFRREVAVARDISSPRLVRVFDIGSSENAIFLTMELVAGESLKERLRRGPLPIENAIAVSQAILEGLDALHSAGVIHRDVKPGNVLLGESGEIKLGDFGLARSEVDPSGLTHSGTLLGTSEYIAPEQAIGGDLDPRSDLYSLGIVMFEMLTGSLPFPAESPLGVLLKRLRTPAPDPREINPEVPRWLSRVVLRLLERRPADRYRTAQEVIRDLARRRTSFRFRRRQSLLVGVLCLAISGIAIEELIRLRGQKFSHLVANQSGGISAISRRGSTLWSDENLVRETADAYAVARISRRGPRLIATTRTSPLPGGSHRHVLDFLDPRSGKSAKTISFPGFEESPEWFKAPAAIDAEDLDGDGLDEIVVAFPGDGGLPARTFLYEPLVERTRLLFEGNGQYRFSSAVDLDGDPARELILTGVNTRLGSYGAAAALRLIPPVNGPGDSVRTSAPDVMNDESGRRALLWYVLLPAALEPARGVRADAASPTLEFSLENGMTYAMGRDGQGEREGAYLALRTAMISEAAESFPAAIGEVERAIAHARRSSDPILEDVLARERARLLFMSGATSEGDEAFQQLMDVSPSRSIVAFEAAHANHLVGHLEAAVRWYERGLSIHDRGSLARPRWTYLEGKVLALVEQKRWQEALDAVSAYGDDGRWPSLFREMILWRMGRRPGTRLDAPEAQNEHARYWSLEFRNASLEEPRALLPELELHHWRPEMGPMIQALRAMVLFRSDGKREALDEVRGARRAALSESRRNVFMRAHLDLIAGRVRTIEADLAGRTKPEPPPGPFTLSNEPPLCDKQPPAGPAVQLRWTPSKGALSYDLHRDGGLTGDRTELTGTSFYNSVGLSPGKTFTFRVLARNGSSVAESNVIKVAIPANICKDP